MNRLLKALRVWPWLAAISSGLLCTGCFPPFDQTWLCWIALTPLITAIWFSGKASRHPWLRNLLLGYVAGLAFFWSVLSWLTTVTVLGWFVLEFYMAIYFALWAWFCGLVRPREIEEEPGLTKWDQMLAQARRDRPPPRSPWTRSTNNLALAFLLAAAWATQEWLRGWVFSGWGWNGLGVALHTTWPLIQIAEFTGVAGLSFMVAFANVIAVTTARRLVLEARTHAMRPHFDLTLTMAAIVGVLTFGLRAAQISPSTKPLRVAAVQANVPQNQKFDPQFTKKIFDQFRRLSEIALRSNPPPDLLVWPESSMPDPVRDKNTASYQFVMDLAASTDSDLLLGTIDEEGGRAYNAALLVSDGGERVQLYRKLHLVPFGEYVPGRYRVPLLARIVGDQVPGDFDAGKDCTVFGLTNNDVQVAPLICFEDTIGELARRFVLPVETNPGANLLVDITNDGWFLRSAGSRQHLANAIFRCVETRRPMVRAANTGVTCFVNELGRITQRLQDENGSTFTEGVLTGEIKVPTEHELTFYTRHGELFAKLCAVITLIGIIVAISLRGLRRLGGSRVPSRDVNSGAGGASS